MLAEKKDPRAKEELTSIMAELLEVHLQDPEIELVTDVLLNLVTQAEKDLRAAIAERVAAMPQLPLRMALSFVNDDIEIASPVLRMGQVLNDMDLIYIIKSQTTEYWQEIAHRQNMSPIIVDILADTNDEETALILIENDQVELTYHAMNVFSDMSEQNESLAARLLKRNEVPETIVQKIYDLVGSDLKQQIEQSNALPEKKKMMDVIDDITFEFTEKDESTVEEPTGDMVIAAEMMMQKGVLSPHMMIQNLKRGQVQNFMAMFSVYTGLPCDVIPKMLSQGNGQGLAVACRALNIIKPDFINVYLLTASLRGNAMIKQNDLNRALTYFDSIEMEDAKEILSKSRH